jgi:hypothetical protein
MICWPVSPRVGNVKNNDPSLYRADPDAMSLHKRFATVFVILALIGCAVSM